MVWGVVSNIDTPHLIYKVQDYGWKEIKYRNPRCLVLMEEGIVNNESEAAD